MPKEHMATIATMITPVAMVVSRTNNLAAQRSEAVTTRLVLGRTQLPMVVSSPVFERWTGMSTAGPRPLSLCARVYMPRLLLGLATAAVVSHAAAVLPVAEGEPLPLLLYGTILAFSVVGSVFATVMFVAQMAFFARVADPAIGGTYMTRAPQPPLLLALDFLTTYLPA